MRARRRAFGIGLAVAAALGGLLAAPGEARAGDGGIIAVASVGVLGFLAADISFAAHDIDAAVHNNLLRDEWLIGETVVAAPQTLAFNALLLGLNTTNDDSMVAIANALGILPTAGVTALTTHGIWGLADSKTDADAMAGISVLTGTNVALTMAALGRATQGKLHGRGIGVFTMILAAPGVGVGIYESTFARPQQGAWIGLTAWSGALFVHSAISAIVDGNERNEPPAAAPEPPPDATTLQRASKHGFGPVSFTIAPTVLSDGVGRMPGLVAAGVF